MADKIPNWDKPSGQEKNIPDWDKSTAPQEKSVFGGGGLAMKDFEEARKRPSGLGAFSYGLGTGTLGAMGDIEQLITQTAPRALGKAFPETMGSVGRKGLYDASTVLGGTDKTFLPTTEMIRQYADELGIPRPSKDVSGYQTAGEISPALFALPKLAKTLVGETGRIGEELARSAEKMGFKLSAPQVAREAPTVQRGAAGYSKANQKLANRKAAEATGKSADEVDEAFIRGRIKDLGSQFDKIYQGKQFKIDQPAINAIAQISANEAAAVGPSGVSVVKSAADDILRAYQSLAASPGASPKTFSIAGEGLQRLRNALSAKGASASGQAKHEIYNLIDEIDSSVARNQPKIAKELNDIRTKYRASVILEDLTQRGGIDRGDISLNRLGEMLRGTSIRRREEQLIDELGKIGKGTNLIALWETPGRGISEGAEAAKSLADALGVSSLGRILTSPLRTRAARATQRALSGTKTGPSATIMPAAVAARTVNPEEQ